MTTSAEITRRPAAPSSAGSRYLARDAGTPAPSQAAQYFQSARSVRPEASGRAAHSRYAVATGRLWARFSVQAAVAFAMGVLCVGTAAVVGLGS